MLEVLDTWETFERRYCLCRGGTRIEAWTPMEPSDARWALRTRFSTKAARRALLGGFVGSSGALPANIGEPGVLERELELRRLVVLEQPIPPIRLGALAAKPTPVDTWREPEPPRKRAWIDIMVIDDSAPARALAQAGFRLRLPDYSTRDGVLDAQGRVYLDDIEPGRCWLELTDPGRGIDP